MLLRAGAMSMSLLFAAPAFPMPDDIARLASTVIDGSALVEDDAPLWFAIPATPPGPSFGRGPDTALVAALADLAAGAPAIVQCTPEFGLWRAYAPSDDPKEAVERWAQRHRTGIDWNSQPDGVQRTRLPLKTAEGFPLSEKYPTAYVFARGESRSIGMLLAPPGTWQQYSQARVSYLQSRPRAPLGDDPAWMKANAHAESDSALLAGFRPARLVSGLHGRLPASSMVARIFDPDAWTDGWAVADVRGTVVDVEGGWTTTGRGGAPLLGRGGDHALLGLVSGDARLAVGVRHAGSGAVWKWVRGVMLEREYEGRAAALLRDEREFEAQLGFSIEKSLLPLVGDHVVAGAPRDVSDSGSWCFIVESLDAPLLEGHVRLAVQRLGGGTMELDRNGIAVNVSRFAGDSGQQLVWSVGDNWFAFGFDQLAFQRFMCPPGESSLRERIAKMPGWSEIEAKSPAVAVVDAGAFGRLAEQFATVAAVGFRPADGDVSMQGVAELRPAGLRPAVQPAERDPFAAAAGI